MRNRGLSLRGFCVWFTGLPCSGKSTLAKGLKKILELRGCKVKLFDGDEVRERFFPEVGYEPEERKAYLFKVAELVKEELEKGRIVICAFVSPYREIREKIRSFLGKERFVEVFVDCPLEVCEKRDKKGLYQKAKRKEIRNFTGLDDPYEPPLHPEIHLRTDICSVEECLEKIRSYLHKCQFLKPFLS